MIPKSAQMMLPDTIQWREWMETDPTYGETYTIMSSGYYPNASEQSFSWRDETLNQCIGLSLTYPMLGSSKDAPIFYNNFIRKKYDLCERSGDITKFAIPHGPAARKGCDSKFVDRLTIPFNGKWYPLPVGKYIIGRDMFCSIKVPTDMINPETPLVQCVIIVEDERIIIVDYWSKNGTRVQKINRLRQLYDADSTCDEMSCPPPGIRKPIIIDRRDPFFVLDVRTDQSPVPLLEIFDAASCRVCMRQQTTDDVCDFIKTDLLNIFCATCAIECIDYVVTNVHEPENIITINEKNEMKMRHFGRIFASYANQGSQMTFNFATVCDLLRRHGHEHLIEKIIQRSDDAKSLIAATTEATTDATTDATTNVTTKEEEH